MEAWKQFTLYPFGMACRGRIQPRQVLLTFLPTWLIAARPDAWHILFEPSALVRFTCSNPTRGLEKASKIAESLGLVFEAGDHSEFEDKRQPEDYPGETDFYGCPGMWQPFLKLAQAASEWSIELQKLDPVKQLEMTRRGLHIYLNTLGLNYLEEHAICELHAERLIELMKIHYRQ